MLSPPVGNLCERLLLSRAAKQKQAEESYINHRLPCPPRPSLFILSPIGGKQSSRWGRAVWQLRRWTPGGGANTNVGHGSEVPSGAGRVYGAPEPQLGLPSASDWLLRGQRSSACLNNLWIRVWKDVFFLNIFIFISILGQALHSASASCQRRQLWSCFRRQEGSCCCSCEETANLVCPLLTFRSRSEEGV